MGVRAGRQVAIAMPKAGRARTPADLGRLLRGARLRPVDPEGAAVRSESVGVERWRFELVRVRAISRLERLVPNREVALLAAGGDRRTRGGLYGVAAKEGTDSSAGEHSLSKRAEIRGGILAVVRADIARNHVVGIVVGLCGLLFHVIPGGRVVRIYTVVYMLPRVLDNNP